MAYFDRTNGDGTEVLCDRCGFTKHHRPTRPTDCAAMRCEIPEWHGWSWEPIDGWCWNPRWSATPHPCAQCGKDANVHIPCSDITPPTTVPTPTHGLLGCMLR